MGYQGKRVVVTGGAGFIGSNLALRLFHEGAIVTVVDSLHPACGSNPFNLESIARKIEIVREDIGNDAITEKCVAGADYIFNLAGNVSHQDSMTHPFDDLSSNAVAHLRFLEVCRRVNPQVKIVYTSTRQLYGVPKYLPVDETHPIRPVDINGVHKFAGEQYHVIYGRYYGMKTVALRLTNTYGPRQLIRHARQGFIGWFVNRVLSGEPIQLFGGGTQLRDFHYVDDVVEAMLLAADQPSCYGNVYNLSGDRASLEEIARSLVEYAGGKLEKVEFPVDRKKIDIGDYYGVSEAFESATHWKRKVSLADGLRRTVDFYRENRARYLEATNPEEA